MVNTQKLHKLGPISGALAMVTDLLDVSTRYYSVQYDEREIVHLVVDPNDDDMYVKCGLPAEGSATMWEDGGKRVTCKRCLKRKKQG